MLGLQQAGRSCTDSKQWYVCSKGPYTGCCSVDPCTDGVCPDEDSTTTATTNNVTTTSTESKSTYTTSKSTSTALSTSETTTSLEETTSSSSSETTSEATPDTTSETIADVTSNTASASMPSTSTSTASSTSSTKSAESTTALTSVAGASQTAISTSSSHKSNAGIIGGVVGAVIAAILLAIFLCFCIKRRRAKVKNTVHRSVSRQSLRAQDHTPTTKKSPSSSATGLVATAKESQHPAASPASNTDVTISSLGNDIYNDYPTGPPSSLSLLTLSTLSTYNNSPTPPSKSSTSLAPLIIPTKTSQPHPHHPPTPQAVNYVPELSDTGFRRQRAELPAQPQSELINQQWNNMNASALLSGQQLHGGPRGASGYTGKYHHAPDAANSETDLITRTTARKVVTRDGVIMGANLDRMSSIDEVDAETPSQSSTPTATPRSAKTSLKFGGRYKKSSRGGTPVRSAVSGLVSSASTPNQHVMSFMEYDAPSEMVELKGRGRRMDVHPAFGGCLGSDSESEMQSRDQIRRHLKALDSRDCHGGVKMDVSTEGHVGSRISGASDILPAYESGGFYEYHDRRGSGSSGWKKVKEDG